MKDFAVLRIFFRGETEAHSIEYKDTMREAETRFHNILAADEGNGQTTYCLCAILDKSVGTSRIEVRDYREEKTSFYPMIRIMEDGEGMHNSVQIYTEHEEAIKRWYGVVAADLENEALIYHAALMMDMNGMTGEYRKAFDRTPAPEPSPEPEPEEGENG